MKLIMRTASVRWKGGRNGGTQVMSTGRGALKQARSENSATDPAELVAAAHAASFSSALSHEIGLAGFASGDVETTATLTLERLAAGWTIMNIHLNVVAKLPKLTQIEFMDATIRAKTSCLVSRLLRATISITAKLNP